MPDRIDPPPPARSPAQAHAAHARFWRSIAEADGAVAASRRALRSPDRAALVAARLHEPDGRLARAGRRAGCARPPLEKIVPYRDGPAQQTYGKPVFYATALACDGAGVGVLVECNMGRPTKIEGNPLHPASLGATDAPRRRRSSTCGIPTARSRYGREAGSRPGTMPSPRCRSVCAAPAARRGDGLVPADRNRALADAACGRSRGLLRASSRCALASVAAAQSRPTHEGARLAYGTAARAALPLRRGARRSWRSTPISWARCPAACAMRATSRRRDAPTRARPRAAACTRSKSTPRSPARRPIIAWPVRASDIGHAAHALAHALGIVDRAGVRDAVLPAWLARARGRGPAPRSDAQRSSSSASGSPPRCTRWRHAINERLGAIGTTVVLVPPCADEPVDNLASLRDLTERMHAGASTRSCHRTPILSTRALRPRASPMRSRTWRSRLHHGLYRRRNGGAVPLARSGGARARKLGRPAQRRRHARAAAALHRAALRRQDRARARRGARRRCRRAAATTSCARYWRGRHPAALRRVLRRRAAPGHRRRAPHTRRSARTPRPRRRGDGCRPTRTPGPRHRRRSTSCSSPDPHLATAATPTTRGCRSCPQPLSQLTWDNAARDRRPRLQRGSASTTKTWSSSTLGGQQLEAPVWIMPGHARRHRRAVARATDARTPGSVGNGRGRRRVPAAHLGCAVVTRRGSSSRAPDAATRSRARRPHHRMEGRDLVRSYTVAQARGAAAALRSGRGRRGERTLYDSPPATAPTPGR